MSIFESMEQLASAALLALAPTVRVAAAPPHPGRGMDLVGTMRARGAGDLIDGYVGELTREIWVGAETRSLPQEALELHFKELAAIVSAHPPTPASLKGILDRPNTVEAGRQIAVDVYLSARSAGLDAAEELSNDVAIFILERSFSYLLREPQRLNAVAPVLAELCAPGKIAAPQVVVPTPAPAQSAPPAATPAPAPAQSAPPAAQARPTAPLSAPNHREAREFARIREKYAISEAAEVRLLALIDSQGTKGDARLARLEGLAAWLIEARAQLMRPTNDDGDLRKLKTRAAEALAAGDLASAMEILKQVRRSLRDGRRRIEARLEDEVAALKVQMTEEARAAARLAELAMARREYLAAADLYFEASDSLPKSARDEAWRYHLARADVLFRKAEEEGDEVALGEALAGYGGVLKLVSDGTNSRASALANIGFGRALHRQSETATGTGRLADAIAAFRKAVSQLAADDEPALWCTANGALAGSLALSGQRGRQVPQLREAIETYRATIAAASDDVPARSIIELRIGLGGALLELAEIDKTANVIEEAVAVYTDVVAALSRTDAPDAWAEASFNLGSTLLTLAEANREPQRLAASVEALSGALEVMTVEHDRDSWIAATMALADALAALAESERPSAARLHTAVATYRRVLEVLDRESAPISWATASMNLGSTLIRLGEQEDKRNNWLTAAGAMVPALEVFEAEGATAHADLARRTLKRFHEEWVGMLSPTVSVPVTAPVAPHLSKVG